MVNINNPKITIVTVTFNAEQYLKKTIESVINQDYKNIEYIIIDGGSTDNTLNIIKQYNKHISYFISEPDNGIYDAMNKAIDIASGEWINFMNAGDTFCDPLVISNFIAFKIPENTHIACGSVRSVDEDDNILRIQKPSIGSSVTEFFEGNHQCCFTKTSIIKKNPFNTTFRIAADFNFYCEIGLNRDNFLCLDFEIANHLVGGFWHENVTKAHFEILFSSSKYIKDINSIFINPYFKSLINLDPNKNINFNSLLIKYSNQVKKIFQEHENVIIYGYSSFFKSIEHLINYNKVIAIADQNCSLKNIQLDINIIHPSKINDYNFDKILIFALGYEKEINSFLKNNLKISKEKIHLFD